MTGECWGILLKLLHFIEEVFLVMFFIHTLQKQSIVHNRNYILYLLQHYVTFLIPKQYNVSYKCNARLTPCITNTFHAYSYQPKQVLESKYLPLRLTKLSLAKNVIFSNNSSFDKYFFVFFFSNIPFVKHLQINSKHISKMKPLKLPDGKLSKQKSNLPLNVKL